MKKVFPFLILFFAFSLYVFAQADSSLKTYTIEAKFDEECSADIVVTLFDQTLKMDSINQVIIDELLRGYYHTRQSQAITLKNFYANKNVDPTGEMMFTIGAECSFHKNGVYSFIACPYNVCEKTARSNFESNCITLDLKTGKTLSLDDIIDPLKRDSFDKYIYYTVTRYHLKNIPSCYISSFHPVNFRTNRYDQLFKRTDRQILFKGK